MSDVPPNSPQGRPSPEVIREFNDRGTLWLLEDPANVRDLLRVLEPELAEHLDFRNAERVNRSFIPADLQKRESDLIFRVSYHTDDRPFEREVWVYVLLEHQSSPDPEMPLRLLTYMTHLWDLQRREWAAKKLPAAERRLLPVVPLVFYTGDAGWTGPLRLADLMDVPADLHRFVPGWETLFLNLKRARRDELNRADAGLRAALQVLREERAAFPEFEKAVHAALAELEGLSEVERAQWVRAVWYLELLFFHRRELQEYTVLARHLRERTEHSKFWMRAEVETMAVTMAHVCEERGEARGEARGLRGALSRMLESKFEELSPEVRAALERADTVLLNEWFERALTAANLDEVGILKIDQAN